MDFENEVKRLMDEHEKSKQWPETKTDDTDSTKEAVKDYPDSDGNKVNRFKKTCGCLK